MFVNENYSILSMYYNGGVVGDVVVDVPDVVAGHSYAAGAYGEANAVVCEFSGYRVDWS